MPKPHEFASDVRSQHRALGDARALIMRADEILAGVADDLRGRKISARKLLRTIGRLLDEASTQSICAERTRSDERTNLELRAVLSALDAPTDRRAFDINTEVHALLTSVDFKANEIARERLRQLRDVLNSRDLD